MNFDLKFFLTIPGLLITGGVLLFIIALIILLVSGKKGKKAPAQAPMAAPAAPNPNMTMAAQPVMPVNNAQSVPDMNAQTVNVAASITDVPAPIPVEQPVAPTPVVEQPVMAQPIEQPVMTQPVMAQPVEQPVMAQPVMAQPVEQPVMAQPVMAQPQQQAPVSIYGGVSPIVPEINAAQPEQHQIYGGADPMENTRSMPVVNQPVMAAAPAAPIPEVAVQPMPVVTDPNQATTIPTINQ